MLQQNPCTQLQLRVPPPCQFRYCTYCTHQSWITIVHTKAIEQILSCCQLTRSHNGLTASSQCGAAHTRFVTVHPSSSPQRRHCCQCGPCCLLPLLLVVGLLQGAVAASAHTVQSRALRRPSEAPAGACTPSSAAPTSCTRVGAPGDSSSTDKARTFLPLLACRSDSYVALQEWCYISSSSRSGCGTSREVITPHGCRCMAAPREILKRLSDPAYLFHAGCLYWSVDVMELQHTRLPGQPTG